MQEKWTKMLQLKPKSIFVIALGVASAIGNPGFLLAQSDKGINSNTQDIEINWEELEKMSSG